MLRFQIGILAAFTLLSGGPLFSAPILHYVVSDFDATQVAAGTVPNPGTLADGITGAFSQPVVTLSTDIPSKGIPYGLGNRSINCAGTSGVNAPGTQQLTKAIIAANGGFTYETWFRWNGVNGAYSIIDYAGTEQIYLNNGVLTMGFNNLSYPTIATVTPNQWHYVAVVFKAPGPVLGNGSIVGDFTFYYDSAQAISIVTNVNINTFGDSLNRTIGVGMHPAAGFNANYFKGLIYSPRVSLGALTASQLLWREAPAVKNVFVEGTGSAARLKADFKSATGKAMFYRVSRDLKSWSIPGRAGMPGVSQTVTAQPGVLRATLDAPFSAASKMFFRASDGLNRKGFVDFDGDGLTDWTIARAGTSIQWFFNLRSGAPTDSITLGNPATDFIVPADYDGDGITDPGVWSGGTTSNFKFIRSSDGQTITIPLGTTGDDPAVVGDYDGDGIDDPAVFHLPAVGTPAGQATFRYVRSSSYPAIVITEVPWGFGVDGELFPYVGDFEGDGKNDFCYQASGGSGTGVFHLLLSSNGAQETIPFGKNSDFLIPGDYDGDGRTDICVRRTNGSNREYYILERDGGGTGATTPIVFGVLGDQSVVGDYDGDGITDLALWRSSSTPGAAKFVVRLSSTGTLEEFNTGIVNDYPVASWPVH